MGGGVCSYCVQLLSACVLCSISESVSIAYRLRFMRFLKARSDRAKWPVLAVDDILIFEGSTFYAFSSMAILFSNTCLAFYVDGA